MRKLVLRGLAIIIIVFLVMALRPINTSEDNRKTVNGVVEQVWDISAGDIIFKLQGDPAEYYINRGKQQGMSTSEIKELVLNRSVEIEFADHWTPLDPRGHHRHITALLAGDQRIYNE